MRKHQDLFESAFKTIYKEYQDLNRSPPSVKKIGIHPAWNAVIGNSPDLETTLKRHQKKNTIRDGSL